VIPPLQGLCFFPLLFRYFFSFEIFYPQWVPVNVSMFLVNPAYTGPLYPKDSFFVRRFLFSFLGTLSLVSNSRRPPLFPAAFFLFPLRVPFFPFFDDVFSTFSVGGFSLLFRRSYLVVWSVCSQQFSIKGLNWCSFVFFKLWHFLVLLTVSAPSLFPPQFGSLSLIIFPLVVTKFLIKVGISAWVR